MLRLFILFAWRLKMNSCVSFFLKVVLLGGLTPSLMQSLDPQALIDKYASCTKRFETIYYELDTTLQIGSEQYVYSFRHCSNKNKMQWIGGLKCYTKDQTLNQKVSTLMADIYDDDIGIHLQFYNPELKTSKRPPRAVLVRSSRKKYLQDLNESPSHGAPVKGNLFGSNNQSVYDLLKGASKLQLHNEPTKIVGYHAYLIEADTQYGIVRAWISPDADYNCLKWEIIKNRNQFYRDGTATNDRFTNWSAVFDAEEVKQIDGQYVITQAKFNHTIVNGNIVLGDHSYQYSLKNIDVEPDYEALGAFEIQLPEGTVVHDEDIPGIRYQWISGRLQPLIDDAVIDTIDSAVAELRNSKNAVPQKQLANSQEDASAKQAAKADPNHLPDGQLANIEDQGESGSWTTTKKLLCYMVGACLILATAFFVYRHRRKAATNEQ